ncbi:aminodeoxychorismate synthase component I [Salinisphaera sp. T31B1]|uniref:aminodeoxychorismate synthase component I n=1 Tax=Salinisphaera sp. T31B1 TaxID=727963 RepID=UPI00333F76C9
MAEWSSPAGSADLLALASASPDRYPFLLESSAGASAQSRYDLLLAFPSEQIAVGADAPASRFFDTLDHLAETTAAHPIPGMPFIGGWFVYLGYEMAAGVEPRLALPRPSDAALPDALAVRCPAAVVHDRQAGRLYVLAENRDHECVTTMVEDLRRHRDAARYAPVAAWCESKGELYCEQVEAIRALIRAGDVFQVNLSRKWSGKLADDVPPASVYAALRAANPAPFSALVQWSGVALCCSSPERLLLIDARVAQTRPIAGTRPRTRGTDRRMTRELLMHPKERAEHIMLIDLERNDLGRVCRPGSIAVDELMVTESYAHVHHIVSNIRGVLAEGVGPGRALAAVFPGGTITGCPKVRCMEIIAELEGEGRGAYTGAIGYLSRCGRMDSNIVIRSLTQQGRQLTLRTGAGIVADSDPGKELEETRVKARGVLRSFVDSSGNAHG